MTLSVYGTVYNSHKTVEAVIKNIFDTFSEIKNNIEVVIVDNYSDDGTYEIIKKMQESYNILLYRKQCTRGGGRNFAFSKTIGKYVLNRDFDDVYIDKTMYILFYLLYIYFHLIMFCQWRIFSQKHCNSYL